MFSGPFERKGELAEKLGLSAGGSLLILDPTSEKPYKPVKRFRSAKSPDALAKAVKKILDKTKLEMRVRRS